MLPPLVKTIEVPCSQEKAFDVFVNQMDTWWPLGKFTVSAMAGAPAKSIRVDAKPGGEITEIGSDDTEVLWGTIEKYDPFGFMSMKFHIPRPGDVVTDRTLVEVEFTALADDQTRVQLTQSNWEALGDMAEMVQGGYGQGWTMIFEQAYKAACST